MAEIIRIRQGESIENFLYDLLEMARKGEINNAIVAAIDKDGNVVTGYYGLDYGQRQTLVSHQQIDIVKHMIDENYVWGE